MKSKKLSNLSIDIQEVATAMIKRGFDGNDFEGWTDSLIDTLEEKYKLETLVSGIIHKSKKGSTNQKLGPKIKF